MSRSGHRTICSLAIVAAALTACTGERFETEVGQADEFAVQGADDQGEDGPTRGSNRPTQPAITVEVNSADGGPAEDPTPATFEPVVTDSAAPRPVDDAGSVESPMQPVDAGAGNVMTEDMCAAVTCPEPACELGEQALVPDGECCAECVLVACIEGTPCVQTECDGQVESLGDGCCQCAEPEFPECSLAEVISLDVVQAQLLADDDNECDTHLDCRFIRVEHACGSDCGGAVSREYEQEYVDELQEAAATLCAACEPTGGFPCQTPRPLPRCERGQCVSSDQGQGGPPRGNP